MGTGHATGWPELFNGASRGNSGLYVELTDGVSVAQRRSAGRERVAPLAELYVPPPGVPQLGAEAGRGAAAADMSASGTRCMHRGLYDAAANSYGAALKADAGVQIAAPLQPLQLSRWGGVPQGPA